MWAACSPATRFYNPNPDWWKKWADYGVLVIEMETSALYTLAAKFKVNALTILDRERQPGHRRNGDRPSSGRRAYPLDGGNRAGNRTLTG